MRSTHHKPMIHGLLEVDVTDARTSLRDYHTRTGEALSFTAFIIACVGQAVDENKAVHALRLGSSRVIHFADVDVLTWVERDVGGQQIILPYICRSANHKSVDQVHREIRTAQVQDLSKAVDGGSKALQRLPASLYPLYFWASTRLGRRYPRQWKKSWGTITVSAVGMFGKGAGWGVPPSTPSLCWVTIGGIASRQLEVNGRTRRRQLLSLTVSFDHNMIDGAPAARFTARLKQLIETGFGLTTVARPELEMDVSEQAEPAASRG
jgi:pyruvate/2-oxoglutarate dehydrogenase complex dihydrolipoamide acyltransferase (E2) component